MKITIAPNAGRRRPGDRPANNQPRPREEFLQRETWQPPKSWDPVPGPLGRGLQTSYRERRGVRNEGTDGTNGTQMSPDSSSFLVPRFLPLLPVYSIQQIERLFRRASAALDTAAERRSVRRGIFVRGGGEEAWSTLQAICDAMLPALLPGAICRHCCAGARSGVFTAVSMSVVAAICAGGMWLGSRSRLAKGDG